MTLELIHTIIIACQFTFPTGYTAKYALAEKTRIENMCVMRVGVCMRNKEIDYKGIISSNTVGLDLLNCIGSSREWKVD